jgi:hypothetical protein
MRQMSLGGSAIETPLKTGYEGQPGDHSRMMHKFMSNRTNIAQFMPQGIKGPKRLLQQSADRDGKMECNKTQGQRRQSIADRRVSPWG